MDYEELRRKYQLPTQDQMEEYDVASIEEFSLREILNKMENRLEFLSNVLEEILQPSPDSVAHLHECRFFSQEEKGQVYQIFKEIQFYLRAIIEAKVRNDPQTYTQTIMDVFRTYPSLKQKALPFVQKLKDSWNVNDELKEYAEYFG